MELKREKIAEQIVFYVNLVYPKLLKAFVILMHLFQLEKTEILNENCVYLKVFVQTV